MGRWPAGGSGRGGPARRYSWAPFEAQHGARSVHRVDPLAAELANALLEDRPDLGLYPESVMAWARSEARCVLFAAWHAEQGFLDPASGEVRGGRKVREYEVLAANLRARLGLDPLADAQLKRAQAEVVALAVDLEGIRERGRVALERRRAELAAGDDQGGAGGS